MNIQLIVQDSQTGEKKDISELVQEVVWTTTLEGTAGQLSFTLIPSNCDFPSGSVVWFSVPNKANIFRGYIFTTSITKTRALNVLAYDQLRYLKNVDTYVFKNMAAHQIFEKICKDLQLKYKIVSKVDYICGPATRDNRAFSEMIQLAIDETYIKTKEYLFIHDDFGTIVLDNLLNYKRQYLLDTDILNLDFSYSRSIDENAANRIKLVRSDQQGSQTQIAFTQDTKNVAKWGVLQHYEVISSDGSQAELDDRAEKLLELKNKPVEKLSFSTEGKLDVFAGCGLYVNLNEITQDRVNKFCIITAAKHTFKNQEHTMNIEMAL